MSEVLVKIILHPWPWPTTFIFILICNIGWPTCTPCSKKSGTLWYGQEY